MNKQRERERERERERRMDDRVTWQKMDKKFTYLHVDKILTFKDLAVPVFLSAKVTSGFPL